MADFQLFLPGLLQREGGWSDNPSDPGGATNKGITFELWSEHALAIADVIPTLDSLRSITDAQAGLMYRVLFWDKMLCDQWQCQDLANIACDFGVNSGVVRAAKLLQSTINQCALGSIIAVDGVIGPATIAALNAENQANVYSLYRAGRIAAYHQIAAANPGDSVFLDGWINRVESFPANASC